MSNPDPPPTMREVLDVMSKSLNILTTLNEKKSQKRFPYYNSRAADEVADAIDNVLQSGAPMIWPAAGISMTTLYLRFCQGAQWLKEQSPDKETWTRKLQNIKITRIPKIGVRIEPQGKIQAYLQVDWRPAFEVFIDEASVGDQFERTGIPISDEDKAYIERRLFPVKDLFVWEIILNPPKILIIRYEK